MKRNVVITLRGKQYLEDGKPDAIELVTEGLMEWSGERCTLTYLETEMTGMGSSAIRPSSGFMVNMNVMDRMTRIRIRNRLDSCPETKLRVVSISDVQRWMISPVWFFICQLNGRRSIWV